MIGRLPQTLLLVSEDLYRLGNAGGPKLDHVRPRDIDQYERNGIAMVRSNGKGISLVTEQRFQREQKYNKGSYAYRLPANVPLPPGLGLVADVDGLKPGQIPEHYLLCPVPDMPLAEFIGLLSKFALHFERIGKL